MVDVRFMDVSPHWYFRPYVGWLMICPSRFVGVFGLVYFTIIVQYQRSIKSDLIRFLMTIKDDNTIYNIHTLNMWLYAIFLVCVLYSYSTLKYHTFYNVTGNFYMSIFTYFYIFLYFSTSFQKSIIKLFLL
jgi:hypothetical protein